jgi:hypothetical protein
MYFMFITLPSSLGMLCPQSIIWKIYIFILTYNAFTWCFFPDIFRVEEIKWYDLQSIEENCCIAYRSNHPSRSSLGLFVSRLFGRNFLFYVSKKGVDFLPTLFQNYNSSECMKNVVYIRINFVVGHGDSCDLDDDKTLFCVMSWF